MSKRASLKKQVGGDHYKKMKFQVWEIIDAFGLNYYEGNSLKYLLRDKPGNDRIEELQKAIHHLEHEIENIEERRQKEGVGK